MTTLSNKNIKSTIENAKKLLGKEENISAALRSVFQLLLVFMDVMVQRLGLNSENSSKPPSSDPNRKKAPKRNKTNRKPGGQPGRTGVQLKPVHDPDKITTLKIDKRTLPKDSYTEAGFEVRQVIDFSVCICITEYQAQVLMDSKGRRYVAPFPEHIKRPIQYGPTTKATAVYMSQFQLMPYARIVDYFSAQVGLNLSPGSLFNFNREAYVALEVFEHIAKAKLISSACLHSDETGININGKRQWLHTACNDKWTHFFHHTKRGTKAMNEAGILPAFKGVLCHDHWKPYYRYDCTHALCNAHHLRELEWAATVDNQVWAVDMQTLLLELNKQVDEAGGKLDEEQRNSCRQSYRMLLTKAQQECPLPTIDPSTPKKRGKIKKSKSRNLLERLMNFEDDVLRFTENINVPFTNNQGENDLRMTKVQQKISGCFRSEEGARIFCRVRSYLITCRKHDVLPTDALKLLFKRQLPDFVTLDAISGE